MPVAYLLVLWRMMPVMMDFPWQYVIVVGVGAKKRTIAKTL